MNLALGALAAVLMAAIVAVLFVGDGEGSTASQTIATTTQTQPTSTSSVSSTSTDLASPPFEMPSELDGRWRTEEGDTIVQFFGTTIESIQSVVELDGESAALLLAEPAQLQVAPTDDQPVQVVVFVTFETDTRLAGPEPILTEFRVSADGLVMGIEIGDSVYEQVLLPG